MTCAGFLLSRMRIKLLVMVASYLLILGSFGIALTSLKSSVHETLENYEGAQIDSGSKKFSFEQHASYSRICFHPRPQSATVRNTLGHSSEKDESHDDSQLRLSYHTMDMSLMGDSDIQAAMLRSASAEVLPSEASVWRGVW